MAGWPGRFRAFTVLVEIRTGPFGRSGVVTLAERWASFALRNLGHYVVQLACRVCCVGQPGTAGSCGGRRHLFRMMTSAEMPARSVTARKVSCHPAVQLHRADEEGYARGRNQLTLFCLWRRRVARIAPPTMISRNAVPIAGYGVGEPVAANVATGAAAKVNPPAVTSVPATPNCV
jgi:hypothetical protein